MLFVAVDDVPEESLTGSSIKDSGPLLYFDRNILMPLSILFAGP